jgi:Fe-Mn family superoxide dismutase
MTTLQLPKIDYDISQLKPVISEINFQTHIKINKTYVDDFNNKSGDIPFNKAGAYLHKLFFENIREHRPNNIPIGKSQQIIQIRYGSFENFLMTYMNTVDKLQGSGWVFMNTSGYLNIIPNNRIVDNIGFVIDFWEHAFYQDYGLDRKAYARDMLHLIDWSVVNERMLAAKSKKSDD